MIIGASAFILIFLAILFPGAMRALVGLLAIIVLITMIYFYHGFAEWKAKQIQTQPEYSHGVIIDGGR